MLSKYHVVVKIPDSKVAFHWLGLLIYGLRSLFGGHRVRGQAHAERITRQKKYVKIPTEAQLQFQLTCLFHSGPTSRRS